MKKKRKIWQALRQALRKSGCTTTTLIIVEKALRPFLEDEKNSSEDDELPNQQKVADSEIMEAAEALKITLHGCVKCNDYVFVCPTNYMTRCPKCRHPRFNAQNQPNEV